MKRNNSFLLLVVALILAFGAAWVANNWIFNFESQSQTQTDTGLVPVVVATVKIPYGQSIEQNWVKLKSVSDALVSEDNFSTLEEVKGLITKGDIYAGELLNRKRVTDKQLGAVLASLITNEMRAVTVRVNDVIGVAGFLLPNNRVDILASRNQNGYATIDTVLQNIKVLAVDQLAGENNKDANAVVVRAVTLEVTPDQAETLYKAIQEGNIQLALRNPEDGYIKPPPPEPVVAKVETPKPVVVPKPEPKPAPKPVAQPKPRAAPVNYSVTVIRGTSTTKKKFNK